MLANMWLNLLALSMGSATLLLYLPNIMIKVLRNDKLMNKLNRMYEEKIEKGEKTQEEYEEFKQVINDFRNNLERRGY